MGTKILIVADAEIKHLIEAMPDKYTVVTACDSEEVMQQLRSNSDTDMMILDLDLPNMNGMQVLGRLQTDTRYQKIRTIVIANSEKAETEIEVLKQGAVDYLRKPINANNLLIRIENNLSLLHFQKMLEQDLLASNSMIETILDQAPLGITVDYKPYPKSHADDLSFMMNSTFEQIVGRSKEQLRQLGWAQITWPDDLIQELQYYRRLITGDLGNYTIDKRYVKPDGTIVWVHLIVVSLKLQNTEKPSFLYLAKDITDRKELEFALSESERSKSVLIDSLPGMAYRCHYDKDWTMKFVSDGCIDLTGYQPENLIDNRDLSYNDLIATEYREQIWRIWKKILADKSRFEYEYEIITKDNHRKWVLELGQGIFDEKGSIEALEGIIIDISERKAKELELKYITEHDTVTGLYNYRYFEEVLAVDLTTGVSVPKAVLIINIKQMNVVSFTYGYHYAEKMIKQLVKQLIKLTTDNCLLYQVSNDRLAFYVKDYNGKQDLVKLSNDILHTVETVNTSYSIECSIGIIEIGHYPTTDPNDILKNASMAAEQVGNNQATRYCFFDRIMEEQINRREIITDEIAQAVKSDADEDQEENLYLVYQPIIDAKTGIISGIEALARFNSKQFGNISALELISIAEEKQLIIPLGRKIMYKAFGFLKELETEGYDDLILAINISAIQLLSDNFLPDLLYIIAQTSIDPSKLNIEITESVFAGNYQEINEKLGKIMNEGIEVAIDDFGTGYSSLARERELNINCLKIDKAFIDKLIYLNPEEAITGDIISMAHKLGHYVVAEGIEHEKQRQYLIEHDCDYLQGYLFSKPLTSDNIIQMLEQQIVFSNMSDF